MEQTPVYHLHGIIKAKAENMEDFNGPLDLILALLSRNKIEIRDIQISLILEQYLEYLDEMKRMDLEIASEFVIMASHLMYLKTKMLLTAGDEETVSELEELMRSLEERRRHEIYGKISERAAELAPKAEFGRSIFTKLPEPYKKDKTYRYEHDKKDLLRAMNSIVERSRQALPPPISAFDGIVGTQPFPVKSKAAELVRRLITVGSAKLRAMFQGSRSRSEIVATFIALLEMCKTGVVRFVGGEDGTEERVTYCGGEPGMLDDDIESDEV